MAKLCLKVSSFILIDKCGNERNIALLVYLKAIDFWLGEEMRKWIYSLRKKKLLKRILKSSKEDNRFYW